MSVLWPWPSSFLLLGATSLLNVFLADSLSSLWTPILLAQKGGPPNDPGMSGFFSSMALPLAATMLLMYFLLMRPESRKRKEIEKQLAALKKNDQVTTVGGIVGTVVLADPQSKYVTIRVDDNTKLKMLRTAIASVGPVDETENKS